MPIREQNLYQIYKFSSTFICENNLDIKDYAPRRAAQEGCLVSCGDNIAFDQARKMIIEIIKKFFQTFNFFEILSIERKKKEEIKRQKYFGKQF